MRRTLATLLFVTLLPGVVFAGTPQRQPGGWGYFFLAPGAASGDGDAEGVLVAGGGGEGVIGGGFGIGAELGVLTAAGCCGGAIGLLSVNGIYLFGQRDQSSRLVPFITGGYSLGFRSGAGHAVNFGGGTHYWFSRHAGARFEVRYLIPPQQPSFHVWSFRLGMDFR